jgi:hypothetical protein
MPSQGNLFSSNRAGANIDVHGELDFIRNLVATEQKKIALDALRGVVFKTRIDTGRARGGWQTNAGDEATNNTAEHFDKNGGDTISNGQNNILKIKPFARFHVVNNVHYIEHLENGSPTNEPDKMAEMTVHELKVGYGMRGSA